MLEVIYWCAKIGHKQHRSQKYCFYFNVDESLANTNSKEQALLTDQERVKARIQISS